MARRIAHLLLCVLPLAACGSKSGLRVPGHDPDADLDAAIAPLADGARPPDARDPIDARIPIDAPIIPDGAICGDVALRFGTIPPTVALVLDRSGSMRETFREPTPIYPEPASRWEVLLELLVGPGLVHGYESRIRFGCATYTQRGSTCPYVTWAPPALANAEAITRSLRSVGPEGGTPTAEALRDVTARLALEETEGGAPLMLLATDGEPTGCRSVDPVTDTVDATRDAFDLGIRTFVVSVADDIRLEHLQRVADAGQGVGPGDPPAELWVATSASGLSRALREVIAAAASCRAELPREADPDRICEATVRIGGETIACGGPDGFRLAGATTLEVAGTACDRLREGAAITATFPCDVLR